MKTLLILLALVSLPACTTSTTTSPDGSVTVTRGVDNEALMTGTSATLFLVDKYSGK